MDSKGNVLIVDDNVGLIKTMSFVLERRGYTVDTAQNGMEAVAKVEKKAYDVIFMDVQMPLMNGVETHRKIKEIRPGSAVVMMTAFAVEDLVREALRDGAYGILHKPVDMEKVIALVEDARKSRNGMLILVVDDDHGTCSMLQSVLEAHGYRVALAHNGEEAVEVVRARACQIILIDMKLPTINGLETYLAIRESSPQTIAIMMTAYREEMDELVEEALTNSAYACIYKPIDMGRLLALIGEIQEHRLNESP
jgi:two-component system, NtrC family, response regulator HydG